MRKFLFALPIALLLLWPARPQTAPAGHYIQLTYTDSASVSFNVYRATVSGGPYTKIASNVTLDIYFDATGVGGTKYFYVITAVDLAGVESANSNETSAVAIGPPGPPQGLAAVSK